MMKCEGLCQYAVDAGVREYSCGGTYCHTYEPDYVAMMETKPPSPAVVKPLTLAKINSAERKHNARVRKLTRDSRNIPIEFGTIELTTLGE